MRELKDATLQWGSIVPDRPKAKQDYQAVVAFGNIVKTSLDPSSTQVEPPLTYIWK